MPWLGKQQLSWRRCPTVSTSPSQTGGARGEEEEEEEGAGVSYHPLAAPGSGDLGTGPSGPGSRTAVLAGRLPSPPSSAPYPLCGCGCPSAGAVSIISISLGLQGHGRKLWSRLFFCLSSSAILTHLGRVSCIFTASEMGFASVMPRKSSRLCCREPRERRRRRMVWAYRRHLSQGQQQPQTPLPSPTRHPRRQPPSLRGVP